jgi:hypothetical protein
MCGELSDKLFHQVWWDICFQIVFPTMLGVEIQKNKCDIEDETWPWTMYPPTLKKNQKHLQNHLEQK